MLYTNMDKKPKTQNLIPTIIQDVKSGAVLMLGYTNNRSLYLTRKTGFVHFWSRSREKIWLKGETSGNYLSVESIIADCDDDAILIQVSLHGSCVCHTGEFSCFFRKVKGETP